MKKIWYKGKKEQLYTILFDEYKRFKWHNSSTKEEQSEAYRTLKKTYELFSSVKPDKKICCSNNGELKYLFYLINAKRELLKGDYWNCCKELFDLVELEPLFQARVIQGVKTLLEGI